MRYGLRSLWRLLFTLPGRTTANDPPPPGVSVYVMVEDRDKEGGSGSGSGSASGDWFVFVFSWLWAIVGAIPGALAAAYIIGRFHITDQTLQNIVSVGLAFVSMLLVQIIAFLPMFWQAEIFAFMWNHDNNFEKLMGADKQDSDEALTESPVVGGSVAVPHLCA